MKTPLNKEFLKLVLATGINRPAHWLHSYIYFSYTQQYLKYGTTLARVLPRIPDFLKDWATLSYRGKTTTLEDAKKLVQVNLNVPIRNVERIIPLSEARDVVHRTGDRILAAECVCRKLKKNPCKPTEVCLFVNREIAGFIHQQKPDQTRWISQEEAVEILEQTERLGWTHLTFSRDIANDEFFVICNCCKCCCAGMMLHCELDVPVLHASGYRIETTDSCDGCGACEVICPFEAISLDRELDRAVIDRSKCMACGVCVSNCPEQALRCEQETEGLAPLQLSI